MIFILFLLDGFLGLFPVGRFNLNGSGLPTLHLNQDLIWPDPNNQPPAAVPICGFQVKKYCLPLKVVRG